MSLTKEVETGTAQCEGVFGLTIYQHTSLESFVDNCDTLVMTTVATGDDLFLCCATPLTPDAPPSPMGTTPIAAYRTVLLKNVGRDVKQHVHDYMAEVGVATDASPAADALLEWIGARLIGAEILDPATVLTSAALHRSRA